MIALEKDVGFLLIIQYKAFSMYILLRFEQKKNVNSEKWRGQNEERRKKKISTSNYFFLFSHFALFTLALSLFKKDIQKGYRKLRCIQHTQCCCSHSTNEWARVKCTVYRPTNDEWHNFLCAPDVNAGVGALHFKRENKSNDKIKKNSQALTQLKAASQIHTANSNARAKVVIHSYVYTQHTHLDRVFILVVFFVCMEVVAHSSPLLSLSFYCLHSMHRPISLG